jgi:RimJ/RimL family protein N-acetyltransferase
LKYDLKLKEIDEKDIQFLYNLLEERKPISYISHKKMPAYEEHVNFVKSSPYSKWYIIEVDGKRAGTIYLTKQNEIGIFLNEGLQEKGIGSNALNVLIGKNPGLRYLANINPENKKSIKFFKKLGFTLIQYTYGLNK